MKKPANIRAADQIYTASYKHFLRLQKAADREENKMDAIGDHIYNGNISQARKMYERNKSWMTLPNAAMKVLYPPMKK